MIRLASPVPAPTLPAPAPPPSFGTPTSSNPVTEAIVGAVEWAAAQPWLAAVAAAVDVLVLVAHGRLLTWRHRRWQRHAQQVTITPPLEVEPDSAAPVSASADGVRHYDAVATSESLRIVLIDDLRSFVDGRSAEVARTSADGVALLERHRRQRLDELWLDHDLGEDDTIWPIVEVLELAAFEGHPFDVGVINVHSANPAGAAKMAQALRHWGYRVRVVSGSTEVGYLSGGPVAE